MCIRDRIETLMVNGVDGKEAVKGDKLTFPFATKVSGSDKLYKIVAADNA